MPETYSKLCQISKMIRHFENPDIVKTVYSYIFSHIQGHSAIFSQVQGHLGTLMHIEAYSGVIEAYWTIFSHIRTLYNPYIYNRAIFRILAYSEPEVSSRACGTCKMIGYIQSPGIVRTVYSIISRKFRDIQGDWCIFSHTHRRPTKGDWEISPAFFRKLKKKPWFWKKWWRLSLG